MKGHGKGGRGVMNGVGFPRKKKERGETARET